MTSDEHAIRDLVALWHSATAAGDADTLLGLMAEDVFFLGPGRPPIRGRGPFESGLRELLITHRVESTGEVQEVEISTDLASHGDHALTLEWGRRAASSSAK